MQATELREKSKATPSAWKHQKDLAITDIKNGLSNWNIWSLMSWQDIRLRYRRSTLGPFWITLSMAVTIYTMGFLYGILFKMDLTKYYPFLASGILSWSLISSILCESTNIFIEAEGFIKQMKQPYSMFIFRSVYRNFTIFFHNIVVFIPIILFFKVQISFYTLLFFLGLIIIWVNAIFFSTILAILGSRYRDLTQLVNSLVQIIFFVTPIIWSPTLLPAKYHFIVEFNPFAQFLGLIRNPLMGLPFENNSLVIVSSITGIGFLISYYLFIKYRSRLVYWL